MADVPPLAEMLIRCEMYEHAGYHGLDGLFFKHEAINHGADEYARDGVTANRSESV